MLSIMGMRDQEESQLYKMGARTILRLDRDDIQDNHRNMSDGECVREQVTDSG